MCKSLDHFAAKCPKHKGGKKFANMVISEAGGISRLLTLARDHFQVSIQLENQESLHFLHTYIFKIMPKVNMPWKN